MIQATMVTPSKIEFKNVAVPKMKWFMIKF